MTARIKPATDQQKRSVADLVRGALYDAISQSGLTATQAQEIITRGGDFKRGIKPELISMLLRFWELTRNISILDLTASELTAWIAWHHGLKYFNPDHATWDFYTDWSGNSVPGRGKKFEVKVWKPGCIVTSDVVREHFRQEGFKGHVGAFMTWMGTLNHGILADSHYVTIPPNDQCWWDSHGLLYVPHSVCDKSHWGFDQTSIGGDWNLYWSFVGFREIED